MGEPLLFLNRTEIIELTGHRRRTYQIHALNAMGIQHKIRPDATIAILREHLIHVFGVPSPQLASKTPKVIRPNWSAI
jgi:hypothetical protein